MGPNATVSTQERACLLACAPRSFGACHLENTHSHTHSPHTHTHATHTSTAHTPSCADLLRTTLALLDASHGGGRTSHMPEWFACLKRILCRLQNRWLASSHCVPSACLSGCLSAWLSVWPRRWLVNGSLCPKCQMHTKTHIHTKEAPSCDFHGCWL